MRSVFADVADRIEFEVYTYQCVLDICDVDVLVCILLKIVRLSGGLLITPIPARYAGVSSVLLRYRAITCWASAKPARSEGSSAARTSSLIGDL